MNTNRSLWMDSIQIMYLKKKYEVYNYNPYVCFMPSCILFIWLFSTTSFSGRLKEYSHATPSGRTTYIAMCGSLLIHALSLRVQVGGGLGPDWLWAYLLGPFVYFTYVLEPRPHRPRWRLVHHVCIYTKLGPRCWAYY